MRLCPMRRGGHPALGAKAEDGVVLLVRVVVVVTDVVVQEPLEIMERTWVVLLVSRRVGRVGRGWVARVAAEEARVGALLVVVVLVGRGVGCRTGGSEGARSL